MEKIQLTKSDLKRTGGGKCPPSCQLGLTIDGNFSATVLRLTIKSIQQRMSNDMTLMGTNRHSQRHLYLSYTATTKTIGQNSTKQFHECVEEYKAKKQA